MDVQEKPSSGAQPESRKKASSEFASAQPGVILWPIEPFETTSEDLGPMSRLVNLWKSASPGQQVLPVSMVGREDVRWPDEVMASIDGMLEPRILVQPSSTRSQSIHRVIELARQEGAEVIAATTHAEKSRGRIRLGGFTENLITHSSVPVLTLNPHSKIPEQISTILMPTDFAPGSKAIFNRVVEWAYRFKAKVIVVNKFDNPVPVFAYGPYTSTVDGEIIAQLMQDAAKIRQHHGHRWAADAARKGVHCEMMFDRGAESLDEMILNYATETDTDLIVMATYRGTLGRLFLGSVARDVLVTASCPVLVIHDQLQP